MSFGQTIAEHRKRASLSQKELARLIRKEDGESISPQYLNDIERDRRNPPSDALIEQFAAVLKIPPEVLYFQAGELTADLKGIGADEQQIVAAYSAFRREIKKNG
jgi:transcriptional regulator with XRE-family HTH domain